MNTAKERDLVGSALVALRPDVPLRGERATYMNKSVVPNPQAGRSVPAVTRPGLPERFALPRTLAAA